MLLLGIQDLQWVKNTLRGISMRVTENYKFGKTHFSLESVILYLGPRGSQSRGTQRLFSVNYFFGEANIN